MKIKQILFMAVLVVAVFFGTNLLETVEKGEYQVRQFPITGTLDVKTTPGMWCQCMGTVDAWPVSQTFTFDDNLHYMPIRFNDGSKSSATGEVRIFMPRTSEQILNLITQSGYRNINNVMEQLIYPHLGRSLRMAANFMTAKESFNEKRPDFDSMVLDQLQNGLYKTVTETRKVIDVLSGKERTMEFKVISKDENGVSLREDNPLDGTGITVGVFKITSIKYAATVEKQIEQQRQAIMAVETASAEAKEAEQNAKTVEAKGKANVMTAKYKMEEEKITAVVQAEKERDVAKLAKDAAEFTKQKEILLGEGEATRKSLVMEADGALEKKLAAWQNVNFKYAEAMQNYTGNWVPQTVMGSSGSGSSNGASDLMQLLTVKTAKDLALDMGMTGKTKGKMKR